MDKKVQMKIVVGKGRQADRKEGEKGSFREYKESGRERKKQKAKSGTRV